MDVRLIPGIHDIVREALTDPQTTLATVDLFIEKAVESIGEKHAKDAYLEGLLTIVRHALRTFYPLAVSNVYQNAESPIEVTFLNSLTLSFLMADPLNLIVTGPHSDVLKSIERYRKPLRRMLEIDKEMGAEPGSKNGFLMRLDELSRKGEITIRKVEKYRESYMFAHRLGFWDAFIITPQAGFPHLRVDGHSIRSDIFVCVPGDESFMLVVECDGYGFHSDEHTFARDRRRDRLLKSHGIDTFRFAGSDIVRDPAACGNELFEYLKAKRRSQ